MAKDKFTSRVAERLEYYVYRLIDPRNGETFYVGKGRGDRVFQHARAAANVDYDNIGDKLKRIREIMIAGFEVGHIIHRHGMDEKTALEVEAALIDAYPATANKVAGHSAERGVMHADEVIQQYARRETKFHHKVVMVNVNWSATESESLYEAARFAWVLSPASAERAEYVLAMQRGIVIGVFIADEWLPATPENFPGKGSEADSKRYGFIGREAPAGIQSKYIQTRLPDRMRKKGAVNPVRYANPDPK